MTLSFLDIDIRAGEGARLLDVVRDLDHQLANAASLLGQTFLVRSPWAPGLRFVGAVAIHSGSTFNVGGAGLSVERALMSCLGEAAERLSQIELPDDIFSRGAPAKRDLAPSVLRLCDLIVPEDGNFDWMLGADLQGRRALIAADWCLRRTKDGPLRIPGGALSTGCAAGSNKRNAATGAILELIERDAAALWWCGAREPDAIQSSVETERLLQELRRDNTTRQTWLLDISSDVGIPVVAALSCDTSGRDVVVGMGCRTGVRDAAHRAIFELCQMEIGLQLARLKPRERLTDDDRRHLARAEISVTDPRLQGKAGSIKAEDYPVDEDPFAMVADALDRRGVDVLLIDFTRSKIGIPVIKAVAPDLQPMPGNIQTDRLKSALDGRHVRWPPEVPLH